MALCIFELNGLEYSFAGQERSHGTSYCVCMPDGAKLSASITVKSKNNLRILEQAVHTFLHFIFKDRLSGVHKVIP